MEPTIENGLNLTLEPNVIRLLDFRRSRRTNPSLMRLASFLSPRAGQGAATTIEGATLTIGLIASERLAPPDGAALVQSSPGLVGLLRCCHRAG